MPSVLSVVLFALLLSACVNSPRDPFTSDEAASATPVGFGVVSYRSDDPSYFNALKQTFQAEEGGTINALAVSGGGANGAFGAGLLAGLTEAGSRPTFNIVTGISTGALIAPFAFLGPAWDPQMREAFTGAQTQHVLRSRGPLIPFGAGFYSRKPLQRLVSRFVTPALLSAVAAEHKKGRLLLVATTDLDADKLVIWDMGAIAEQDGPAAKTLFTKVLIASASIPGLFAPTLIPMQAGGREFKSMHVDGGVESDFFAVPQTLLLARTPETPPYKVRLFILVNGDVASQPDLTPHGLIPVVRRSLAVSTRAGLRSLLIATYEYAKQPKHELYIASMPLTAKDNPLDFSASHLEQLYSEGRSEGLAGKAWRTQP